MKQTILTKTYELLSPVWHGRTGLFKQDSYTKYRLLDENKTSRLQSVRPRHVDTPTGG